MKMRTIGGFLVIWQALSVVPVEAAGGCIAPPSDGVLPLEACGSDTAIRAREVVAACTRLLPGKAPASEMSTAEIHYNRGRAHVQRLFCGKAAFSEAIGDLDEAIRLNPAYQEAYGVRALAHEYMGNHMRAVADYRRAYRIGIPPRWLVERLEIIENAP